VQCVYPWVAETSQLWFRSEGAEGISFDGGPNLRCLFHRGCGMTAKMFGARGTWARTQIFGDVTKAMKSYDSTVAQNGLEQGFPQVPKVMFGKQVGEDVIGKANNAKIWPLTPVLQWDSNQGGMSWTNPNKLVNSTWAKSMEVDVEADPNSPYNAMNRSGGKAAKPPNVPAFKGLEVVQYYSLPDKPLSNKIGQGLNTDMITDPSACRIYGRRF